MASCDPHVADFLARLDGVRASGAGHVARCPAHDDRSPSLSVRQGDDGRILIKCFAGCAPEAIVAAVGLTMRDLYPTATEGVAASVKRSDRADNGFIRLAKWSYTNCNDERRADLAKQLGVSLNSLKRLRVGLHGNSWTFPERDAARNVIGISKRDTNGQKRCITGSRRGLIIPTDIDKLPDPVLIVEGASDTAALLTLGLTAVGRPSADQGASHLAELLRGRDLIVLGERDGNGQRWPGRDGATKVAQSMADSWRSRVRWALPPEPQKDVRAWLAAQGVDREDAERCRALGQQLLQALERSAVVEEPNATANIAATEPAEYEPFPLELLPDPIGRYIAKAARATQCDPVLIAQPMLAALAAAIGNTRRIRLKRGWSEPAVVWAVTVAPSGTRKSPAMDKALAPLRKRQAEAMKTYAEAQQQYERDQQLYEADFAEWKRNGRKKGEPAPESPVEPVAHRLIAEDVTIEALAALLEEQPRGLLVARDELSGWVNGFDRYISCRGAEVAHWLSMHGARQLVVDRKTGRKTIFIERAAASICGTVQPKALAAALAGRFRPHATERETTAQRDREHVDNGLAARLLFVMPPKRRRRWTEAEVDGSLAAKVETVFDRLLSLDFHDGASEPVELGLTADAKDAWVIFYNEHADEEAALPQQLGSAWSKLEGYAARFALIIHLTRWVAGDPTAASPDEVDDASVRTGIELARWFGREAARVYAALGIASHDMADTEAKRLASIIRRKGGPITARELMRSSRRYATAESAEAALKGLVERGLAAAETDTHDGKQGRPVARFRLVAGASQSAPSADTNGEDPEENGFVSASTVAVSRQIDDEEVAEWTG